jgi:hypothetical protein
LFFVKNNIDFLLLFCFIARGAHEHISESGMFFLKNIILISFLMIDRHLFLIDSLADYCSVESETAGEDPIGVIDLQKSILYTPILNTNNNNNRLWKLLLEARKRFVARNQNTHMTH